MDFWIFIFLMSLLIPLVMIGFGSYFVKKPPSKINLVFGYRTSMSMKNKDTWTFAHNYCGKLWQIMGLIMFLFSVVVMFFVVGSAVDTVSVFGCILVVIQMFFLVGSIIPTELALRKTFDKNGNRKK